MEIEILTYQLKEGGIGYRIIGRENDETKILCAPKKSFPSEEAAREGAFINYLIELESEHGCNIRSGRF